MRLHEIMGIEANRRWGVCSLNDFRKVRSYVYRSILTETHDMQFLGLKSRLGTWNGFLLWLTCSDSILVLLRMELGPRSGRSS